MFSFNRTAGRGPPVRRSARRVRRKFAAVVVWLLRTFGPAADAAGQSAPIFLAGRAALAAVTAFFLALAFGPRAISWLRGRFREPVKSASATLDGLHAGKTGTPTMGGLFTVAAVLLSGLVWADAANPLVRAAAFVLLSFATLGAADDWVKLKTARRGLSASEKLAAQFGLAGVAGGLLQSALLAGDATTGFVLPAAGWEVPLGLLFVPWAALATVAGSNAVNLTDGLDGLAAGCAVVAAAATAGLCYLGGHAVWAQHLSVPHVRGAGELSVLAAALAGASLGFLWFNAHPAQVFMGDTGALSAGALLAFCAVAVRQEVVFLLVAGVFAAEAGSVILQVGCFRLTGRKPILCSPLHNHFVFRGDPETRIVARFWIGSAVCAATAAATLTL